MQAILILNAMIAAMIAYFNFVRTKQTAQAWAQFALMATFPLGGILIVFILFELPLHHDDSTDEIQQQLDGIQHQYGAYQFIPTLNVAEESNVVPLSDMLLIADYAERRKAMLSVLRKDTRQYAKFINLALQNEDGETAHYAASGVLHQKNKLDNQLSEIEALLKKEEIPDRDLLISYADLLISYISSAGIDVESRKILQRKSIEALQTLVNISGVPVNYPVELLKQFQSNRDWAESEKVCRILHTRFPKSEMKSLALMNYYYTRQDLARFRKELHDLRQSDLVFSTETMNCIRFWLGDAQ